MANAAPPFDPDVLVAALRDVEGRELDLGTVEGREEAGRLVESLLADDVSADRLTEAIERHAFSRLQGDVEFPAEYGPLTMTTGPLPAMDELDVPPIGSTEFEEFMAMPERHRDSRVDLATTLPMASPVDLGFTAESAEPPPNSKVDAALRDAQRVFEVKLNSSPSLTARVRTAWLVLFHGEKQDWQAVAWQKARNRFVVELTRDRSRLHWESIAAGNILYVLMVTDGRVSFRGELPLSDLAATRSQLEEAFGDEPQAGERTLRALRTVMSSDAFDLPRSVIDSTGKTTHVPGM